MPPYKIPQSGTIGAAKYIFFKGELYTSAIVDDVGRIQHVEEARRDGILHSFHSAAETDADSVHAGIYFVVDTDISVYPSIGRRTLSFRPTRAGFDKALATFRSLSPGFKVSEGGLL